MKKLIYVTGSIDNPFFINEIEYIKKEFDDIFVITYDGDISIQNKIAHKYNIRFKKISIKKDFYKGFTYFFPWLLSKHVKSEIKNIFKSDYFIKKLMYIFYYGIFDCISSSIIKNETEQYSGDIILYSYWLSRGAYTIARNHSRKNVKIAISRAHGYDLYEERNVIHYLPFRQFINKKLDCIAFISNNGYEYYQSKFFMTGKVSEKMVIPLGVSESCWVKQKTNNNEIVIASCSSCIEIKRLDLIVKFINAISKKTSRKVKWIHIGDGLLFEKYKSTYIGSNTDVIFLGHQDNSIIRSKYREYNVDFFINLSDSEGVPVSIMEAMSCGIPCIARNVGGNSEIVNKYNGFMIEELVISDQVFSKYADLVLNSIDNSVVYHMLSVAAYQKWISDYNSKTNYCKFIDSIIRLIK